MKIVGTDFPAIGRQLLDRVLARPASCLLLLALLTLPSAIGLAFLELRVETASLYPARDPVVQRSLADRQTFHEPDEVIILATARAGERLDSRGGLGFIAVVHDALLEIPGVDPTRLRSPANAIEPEPGGPLSLGEPLLGHLPEDPREFAAFVERLRGSARFNGLFLSPDGMAAAFYVRLAGREPRDAFVERLRAWAQERQTPEYALRLTGPVAVEVASGRAIVSDLARLIPVMFLCIAAFLYAGLRSLGLVAIVLTRCIVVLIWTFGTMGLCGVPLTRVTTILPVVLIAMAIGDDVHLFTRFHVRWRERCGPAGTVHPVGAKTDALRAALRELTRPIVLTTLTTAVGALSLLSASVQSLRHFGLFAALGILAALGLTYTLVPALVVLLPDRWLRPQPGRRTSGEKSSAPIGRALARREVAALLACCGVLAALATGVTRLSLQESWIHDLASDSEEFEANRELNRRFWGSNRFDIVLRAAPVLFFHQPEGLQLLETIRATALKGPHVAGVVSPLDAAEIMARAEGYPGPLSSLPRDVLADRASLLQRVSRLIDLDHVLRFDGAEARLRLYVANADSDRAEALEQYFAREIAPVATACNVAAHFSGDLPSAQATAKGIVGNVARSLAWTLAGVTGLLAVGFRSVRVACCAVVPACCGVVAILGGMGWAGMPLGIATSMFAALAMGVGVDHAVHLIYAYREAEQPARTHAQAVAEAPSSTGHAMLWTTIVVTAGLLVLTASELSPNRRLGFLLAASMIACLAATVAILPVLLRFAVSTPRIPASLATVGQKTALE